MSEGDSQKLDLLKTLVKWRNEKAAELGYVKPTYFYTNKTLEKIATAVPTTQEELLKAYGVSGRELDDFEIELLELIKDFKSKEQVDEERPIENKNLEFYKLLVEMAWTDGVLTEGETEKLKIARNQFNISEDEHNQIESEIKKIFSKEKIEDVVSDKQILILAITEFFDKQEKEVRYCIAGIDIKTNEWIRPINSSYEVGPDDSKRFLKVCDLNCDNELIRMYDVVEFNFVAHVPTPPHVEDYLIGSDSLPKIIESFSSESLKELFEKNICDIESVTDIGEFLISKNKSLILIKPDNSHAYEKPSPSPYKDYDLFMWIKGLNYDMKIKDLEFLSFYRDNSSDTVRNLLRNRDVYLSIGLTRKFKDRHWPMVVGVHTISKDSRGVVHDKVEFKLSPGSKKWDKDTSYHERIRKIRKKSPRAYEKWSKGEDQKLKELFETGKSIPKIANVLERQNSAIITRLKKLGLIKR